MRPGKMKRAPLAEELVQARTVYADSFRHVKKFMRSIQSGPVDIAASEPYVEGIISSLSRNADALISLSKLKTYDEYTYVHSVNVTIFAVAFARYLGFDDSKLHLVGMAGLFHDIGKELIPVSANPDGSVGSWRIAPEQVWTLRNTFTF